MHLLPLLLIMLCGPDLARERESGTRRTLRAAGVAAGAATSGGLFPDDTLRGVLWLLAVLGYGLVWALLALGVSAWAGSVRLALTLLVVPRPWPRRNPCRR